MSIGVGSLALLALSAPPAMAETPSTHACGMVGVDNANQLHRFLSLRAVEIVVRAGEPNSATDSRIRELIPTTATFSYGGGDIRFPLPNGPEGARALAQRMSADTYRFMGWDFIPYPVDPCSSQEVEVTVDFIDTTAKAVSPVTFTFKAGRLVKADGWSRSFETGRIGVPSPK